MRRINIINMITLLIFAYILSMGYASAATDLFENYADNSQFIASKGILPDTIDQEWISSIKECWLIITKEIGPSYSEFDSSIVTVACDNYLLIMDIDSDYRSEINDSRIDEMYLKIAEYCEQQAGITDVPVVFMWDEDDGDLSLPDYGPEMFEKAANSSGFVAARGTMPVITDEGEKREWTDQLVKCSRANDKIDNYFSSGQVVFFGSYIDGYLQVCLNSATPEKVNDSVIDEIYRTIDEAAQGEGVTDVPVVFIWGSTPDEDQAIVTDLTPDPYVKMLDENGNYIDVSIDDVYINENGNFVLKNSTEESATENYTDGNIDSSQSTPGFTSIMLVLCILILTRFRK